MQGVACICTYLVNLNHLLFKGNGNGNGCFLPFKCTPTLF